MNKMFENDEFFINVAFLKEKLTQFKEDLEKCENEKQINELDLSFSNIIKNTKQNIMEGCTYIYVNDIQLLWSKEVLSKKYDLEIQAKYLKIQKLERELQALNSKKKTPAFRL